MIVEMPAELTVARAVELRALLLSALDRGEALELRGDAVVDVDVAGLQVLCAAQRSARARNLELTLSRQARSAALSRAITTAGFGHADDDRWLIEEQDHG